MRKLTPEERAAKNAGQVIQPAVEVVAEESKKKAKKADKSEPKGIGSDSFVFSSNKSVEENAPVVAEKEEKAAEAAPVSEEDSTK